jgi:hypothetical protein
VNDLQPGVEDRNDLMVLSEEIGICGQYCLATVLGEPSNPMDIVGSALIIPQHTGNFEL